MQKSPSHRVVDNSKLCPSTPKSRRPRTSEKVANNRRRETELIYAESKNDIGPNSNYFLSIHSDHKVNKSVSFSKATKVKKYNSNLYDSKLTPKKQKKSPYMTDITNVSKRSLYV